MQRYRLITGGFVLLAILIVGAMTVGSVLLLKNSSAAGNGPGTNVTTTPDAKTIDAITMQVLENMHLHAWNPQAMTKNQVTGGLFINWQMNNPSITNVTRPGADGTTIHDHDPQVDLLYLTSLAEYKKLHPTDTTFDADLNRATATVLTDFQRYSLPKGWIYFYLLNDGLLLNRADIVSEAQGVATNLYNVWYDPSLGTVYDHEHTPGDYSTNHTLESGVALIEAGKRWNKPNWISAGVKTVDHTLSVALNQKYNLFYDSMLIQNGQDKVESYESRPSTDGESVEALVMAYQLTHNQHYMDVATTVLKSLFDTSHVWDSQRGGFYFTRELNSGKLVTNYKETRSQTWVLIGLHSYNRVSSQPLVTQEQQLVSVITNHFYQSTYHGFVYRLTPDFHIYTSKPGAGPGLEDYFTTEAMGASMDALQQTEMIMPVQGGNS